MTALQALYEACTDIELAVQVALDEGGEPVVIRTSPEKALALLAAIEQSRAAGLSYGGLATIAAVPGKVEVREVTA